MQATEKLIHIRKNTWGEYCRIWLLFGPSPRDISNKLVFFSQFNNIINVSVTEHSVIGSAVILPLGQKHHLSCI